MQKNNMLILNMIIHVRNFPHNGAIFESGRITLHITMIIITTADFVQRDIKTAEKRVHCISSPNRFGARNGCALSARKNFQ